MLHWRLGDLGLFWKVLVAQPWAGPASPLAFLFFFFPFSTKWTGQREPANADTPPFYFHDLVVRKVPRHKAPWSAVR